MSLAWETMRDADSAVPLAVDPAHRAQLPGDTVAFLDGMIDLLGRDRADSDRVAIERGLIILGQLNKRLGPGLIPSPVILLVLYRDWMRYLRYAARSDAATRAAIDAEVAAQLTEIEHLTMLSEAIPEGRA